jgi:hypothetical protein
LYRRIIFVAIATTVDVVLIVDRMLFIVMTMMVMAMFG